MYKKILLRPVYCKNIKFLIFLSSEVFVYLLIFVFAPLNKNKTKPIFSTLSKLAKFLHIGSYRFADIYEKTRKMNNT